MSLTGVAREPAYVRVVVVHVDGRVREEVANRLAADDVLVVGQVDSPEECVAYDADAVVAVHRLPGTRAADVCERLRGRIGAPGVVVLAHAPRAVLVRRCVQEGAAGFVAADSPAGVLREAVRWAASGRVYIDPAVGSLLVELIARTRERRPYGLTRAQLDVAALLPKGLTNREIAAELGISENTVKTHLRHALRKLGVPNRAQAAASVVREGLS